MKPKKISIIIPVYNEEKTIVELLNRVKDVKFPLKKEIVVVDDCSNDNSLIFLKTFSGIKLIRQNANKGKGAAIRMGLRYATGDIIIIQDADLEYDPKQIPSLIEPILNNKAKVVYGSRFLNKSNQNWKIPLHYIGNKALIFLTNLLYGCKLTDMETGYKAFHKSVAGSLRLRASRFDFEPEITAKILKKGYKIKELPIYFNPRTFNEGKKISWVDGVKAVYYLIYYRFSD